MAFNRVVEMLISTQPSQGSSIQTDISNLHIDFDIRRSILLEENTAKFTIYNAKEETRKNILTKNNNVVFKAGYEDEGGVGTIYIGNITSVESKWESSDWITEMSCTSQRTDMEGAKKTYLARSYSPGTPLSAVLLDVASSLGVVLIGRPQADYKLPNGLTWAGNVNGLLRYAQQVLKPQGVNVYKDNTELIVYRRGVDSSIFELVQIDFNSGLKYVQEAPEYDPEILNAPKRIQVGTILIPTLQPNSTINIVEDIPDAGAYVIEVVEFKGNNYGGDFDAEMIASA